MSEHDTEYVVVGCYDCGLAYGSEGWIECMLPRDVWCKISPTGNEGGILCITCIARRLKRAGCERVPVMLCGTEAIVVAGQDEAFDRGWKVAEKRIRELDTALLAARRDSERLDWLDKRKLSLHGSWEGGEGFGCPASWQNPSVSWSISRTHKCGTYDMPPELVATSVREAIDAALAATQEEK